MSEMRILIALLLLCCGRASAVEVERDEDVPNVFVALFVRNKAHTLPYFLKLFEDIDYPKERMILWIKSDQNQDRSLDILNKWIPGAGKSYQLTFRELSPSEEVGGKWESSWPAGRLSHIIDLKEEALARARHFGVEYIWFLDCDVFLVNNQTLKELIGFKRPLVAPMLDSLTLYSNYWGAMGTDYYYQRTAEYKPIRVREKKDCHAVAVIHTCFLIDLTRSETLELTFRPQKIAGYSGPGDDVIVLAVSAERHGIPMYVCNQIKFGYVMMPLDEGQGLADDLKQLQNIKHQASVDFPPMVEHPLLAEFVSPPARSRLQFDDIFVINLERRPERRRRMEWSLRQFGLDFQIFKAVDGRTLNVSYIESLGIRMLPNYKDPNGHRPMTMGEIGCFLSHYNIWKEIVERGLEKSIIFEDDVHFMPNFEDNLASLMDEADRLKLDWDLIFIGRKKVGKQWEDWVAGSSSLLHVDYSYWLVGYILSNRGAAKLLKGNPLGRLVPADEYIPIMYNRHPEERWAEAFPDRDLKAFSAVKLLVYPTQYTGQPGYFSDTEWSEIIPEAIRNHAELNSTKNVASEAIQAEVAPEGEALLQFNNERHTEL